MNLLSLFRWKKPYYGSYKKSSHVELYEQIAREFRTSPQHVYELAHGKYAAHYTDKLIREKLISKGLITTSF